MDEVAVAIIVLVILAFIIGELLGYYFGFKAGKVQKERDWYKAMFEF